MSPLQPAGLRPEGQTHLPDHPGPESCPAPGTQRSTQLRSMWSCAEHKSSVQPSDSGVKTGVYNLSANLLPALHHGTQPSRLPGRWSQGSAAPWSRAGSWSLPRPRACCQAVCAPKHGRQDQHSRKALFSVQAAKSLPPLRSSDTGIWGCPNIPEKDHLQ